MRLTDFRDWLLDSNNPTELDVANAAEGQASTMTCIERVFLGSRPHVRKDLLDSVRLDHPPVN